MGCPQPIFGEWLQLPASYSAPGPTPQGTPLSFSKLTLVLPPLAAPCWGVVFAWWGGSRRGAGGAPWVSLLGQCLSYTLNAGELGTPSHNASDPKTFLPCAPWALRAPLPPLAWPRQLTHARHLHTPFSLLTN